MSANYWESTQHRSWQFSKKQLGLMRQELDAVNTDLIQMFPLPGQRHLSIYLNQQIGRLGKRLTIRQQALATAQVYVKRFYLRVEIRRTNPYLIAATALYLACKMEECPQHIRLVVTEARLLWQDLLTVDTTRLAECEFFLISELSSQLVIHQPYRSLSAFQLDFALSGSELGLGGSLLNDHYMTDLPLLYPPHIVALTALLLVLTVQSSPPSGGGAGGGIGGEGEAAAATGGGAVPAGGSIQYPTTGQLVMAALGAGPGAGGAGRGSPVVMAGDARPVSKTQQFATWLAESGVDIRAVVDCTQEVISFYECYELYSDKLTRDQVNRFVRARGLDK